RVCTGDPRGAGPPRGAAANAGRACPGSPRTCRRPRRRRCLRPVTRSARPRIAGIVLAGGGTSRFGADKLQAEIDGRPLLHLPIEALAEICSEIVVVVSGED